MVKLSRERYKDQAIAFEKGRTNQIVAIWVKNNEVIGLGSTKQKAFNQAKRILDKSLTKRKR